MSLVQYSYNANPIDDVKIRICFKDQEGKRALFVIKKGDKLQKVLDEYHLSQSLEYNTLRFITPEGDRMLGSKTPNDYSLEDGDMVDVLAPQSSGVAGASFSREF